MKPETIDLYLDECGITSVIYESIEEEGFVVHKDNNKIATECYVTEIDGNLYAASRELLKVNIQNCFRIEKWKGSQSAKNQLIDFIFCESVQAILAALPGKTWEEIKKRLEEMDAEV